MPEGIEGVIAGAWKIYLHAHSNWGTLKKGGGATNVEVSIYNNSRVKGRPYIDCILARKILKAVNEQL